MRPTEACSSPTSRPIIGPRNLGFTCRDQDASITVFFGCRMTLNLITDAWIQVVRNGEAATIRPDQIAEPGVQAPNWPRPDLNLACYELLIGLVYLACPPQGIADWRARRPDPEALRKAMAPLAPAFNLTGEGPLFLQDIEPLHGAANRPDILFIDSSGASTAGNNADLMVKRARYDTLDLPTAAMALFTLQSQAPSGGAGNRTSMRGGGPMITLVRPADLGEHPLWTTIWANVPDGEAVGADELDLLPWMRPTKTSEKGQITDPPEDDFTPPETFFGMPRRIRLVEEAGRVTGVIQRPRGTNYGLWRHPLSPYYALKEGADILPRHPKPGALAYRNWFGISVSAPPGRAALAYRATSVERYEKRAGQGRANVLVAGWAMANMSPLDFLWSEQPLFDLVPEAARQAEQLAEAANVAASAMVGALRDALGIASSDGARLAPEREAFYLATEGAFVVALEHLAKRREVDKTDWMRLVGNQALDQFDVLATDGLADLDVVSRDTVSFSNRPTAKRIVMARMRLLASLKGNKMHDALGLERPPRQKKKVTL